jgi:hypothetical protein
LQQGEGIANNPAKLNPPLYCSPQVLDYDGKKIIYMSGSWLLLPSTCRISFIWKGLPASA